MSPVLRRPRSIRLQQIRDLAETGLTASQISKAMQYDESNIRRLAKEEGIGLAKRVALPPGEWRPHEGTGFMVSAQGVLLGRSGRELHPFPDKSGYPRVNTYLNGARKQLAVHRIVCETFHGPQPKWADLVAHADGNPSNCSASNLRWATFLQNEEDKRRHGRELKGEGHHQHKLTEAQVREIRSSPLGSRIFAVRFGVHEDTIGCIRRGKTWRHIL